jgi:hypothetical protein
VQFDLHASLSRRSAQGVLTRIVLRYLPEIGNQSQRQLVNDKEESPEDNL